MKKLLLALSLTLALFLFSGTSCSPSNKEGKVSDTQNIQAEVQQPKPEEPYELLRKKPDYERVEKMLRDQIEIHSIYYYYTPEGKAKPKANKDEDLEKLLSVLKTRYSLTDLQVNTIRNNQLYIGMPRTCIYLAWGQYRGSIGLPPEEEKSVSSGMVKHKIMFRANPGKIKTAYTENDVLVSYQE